MQRYAWEVTDDTFVKEIEQPCELLVDHYRTRSRSKDDVTKAQGRLKEVIGVSEILFFKFCSYCHDQTRVRSNTVTVNALPNPNAANELLTDMSPFWGRLIVDVVVKLQEYHNSSVSSAGLGPSLLSQGSGGSQNGSYLASGGRVEQRQSRVFGKTIEFALLLDSIRRADIAARQNHLKQVAYAASSGLNRPPGAAAASHTNSANTTVLDDSKLYQLFNFLKIFIYAQSNELERRQPPSVYSDKLKIINSNIQKMTQQQQAIREKQYHQQVQQQKQQGSAMKKAKKGMGRGDATDTDTGFDSSTATTEERCKEAARIREVLQFAVKELEKHDADRIFAYPVSMKKTFLQ